MALLPARNILDGTALPVTSQMKTSLGSLRDYLSDLLGTDSSNKAAARTALGIPDGQIAGLRNRIINGNFSVNQRAVTGTVVLAAGMYGHDRFKAGASGCTYTFATTANVTTLTITAGSLVQVVEGLNLESGTFALSWVGTAQGKIGAGSYGASGITGAITGGTNTNIEFSTGTVSRVQLELGTIATVFEQRPYGMELALCQRYYYQSQSGAGDFIVSGIASSGSQTTYHSFKLPVTMRASATVTAIGSWTYTNATSLTVLGSSVDGWRMSVVSSSAGVFFAYNNVAGQYLTASAEI